MGERYHYQCECGYQTDLNVGTGMNSMNKNLISACFAEEVYQAFREEEQKGNICTYLIEESLAECRQCNALVTVAHLHYENQQGRGTEFVQQCRTCKNDVQLLSDAKEPVCPRCGQTMKRYRVGFWD